MPLSTIERPRLTGSTGGLPPLSGVHHPPGSGAAAGGALSAYGYAGRSSAASGRAMHSAAPPYSQQGGAINGHTSVSNAPTLRLVSWSD